MLYLMTLFFFLTIFHFFNIKIRSLKKQITYLSKKNDDLITEKNNYIREILYLNWNIKVKQITYHNSQVKKYIPNRQLKVLVADYYDASANITDSVLQNIGIYADFVSNGEDVVDKIKKGNNYDLIITNNILCGKLDGHQTLLELRDIKDFSIPIIILTVSHGCYDYFINECEFDGYIEKPLNEKKAIKIFTNLISDLKFIKVKNK